MITSYFLRRKQKLEKSNKQKLPKEFADVLITALLHAKSMDVDVEAALEKKISKLNRRIGGVDVRWIRIDSY